MTVAISNLRCFRGAFSLDIPSLAIAPGALVGLVGANGAGKSTLLDVIAGFIKPESGTVRVFGVDPTAQATIANLRQRIAWMTDDMPLFDLTLAQHINVLSGFYPTWDAALSPV